MVLTLDGRSEPVDTKTMDNDIANPSTMSGLVSIFTHETSLHGIKFVLQSRAPKPRRIFWGVVMLLQLGVFIIFMVRQLGHVYQHPMLTKVITKYVDKIPFPAVTLCSDLSLLENDSTTAFQKEVLQNIWAKNTSYFRDMPKETYATINVGDIYKVWFLSTEQLVQRCEFSEVDCMKYIQRTWGSQTMCYTINSGVPDEILAVQGQSSPTSEGMLQPLVSTAPGADMGLELTLKPSGSVKVLIHEPDEKITQSNSEFLLLAPGSFNYIGIQVRQNTFLPPPFKAFGDRQCKNTSGSYRHPLVQNGRYTLRACNDACVFKQFEHRCGCRPNLDEDSCDPLTLIECVYPERKADRNTSSTRNPYDCNCPFPCEDIVYDTTLSSVPTSKYWKGRRPDNIGINIHFDRLRIESTEQVEDYTREDVFASVGGQMGLFLGASIITLVEIAELLARCICRRLLRSSNTVTSINTKQQLNN